MRIVDVRETAVPLKSALKNSSFDFSEMTTSIVAVITDIVRSGRPVVGFAFNSTGRYACGAQMRERFIPRILRADPSTLLNDRGDNLDPARVLADYRLLKLCMFRLQEPPPEFSIEIKAETWFLMAKLIVRLEKSVVKCHGETGSFTKSVLALIGMAKPSLEAKLQQVIGGGMYIGGQNRFNKNKTAIENVAMNEKITTIIRMKFWNASTLRNVTRPRSAAERSRSAEKAAQTKGPAKRHAAAMKAVRTKGHEALAKAARTRAGK